MNTEDASKVTSRPQYGPGIWRMERGVKDGKKMPSKLDLLPKSESGKRVPIQGQPRKRIEIGGVQLILAPMFKAWIERSPRRAAEWKRVKEKRRYFLCLARVTALPINSGFARIPLAYCKSTDPELTRAALSLLRRRWAKVTLEDYKAACSAPDYGTAKESHKIPSRERTMRGRFRAAETWISGLP